MRMKDGNGDEDEIRIGVKMRMMLRMRREGTARDSVNNCRNWSNGGNERATTAPRCTPRKSSTFIPLRGGHKNSYAGCGGKATPMVRFPTGVLAPNIHKLNDLSTVIVLQLHMLIVVFVAGF